MKIVFIMRHSGYVRNFESTLRMLCERGHRVHLAYQVPVKDWLAGQTDIGSQLAGEFTNFSHGAVPSRNDGWGLLGRDFRLALDYLRYLAPAYRDAPKLRRRAERAMPPAMARLVQRPAFRSAAGRAVLVRSLKAADRSIPRRPAIDAFFDEHRPDVLLVTPLIEPGGPQADYVRSARSRGVRTVLCVASWDNLTNKGLIHDELDLVAVWNDQMKREAIELHGVPAARVVVTGAQPFDHWFDWKPSRDRANFLAAVGLPADKPYLLYLCSSRFVAPEESGFVRRWAAQLRAPSSPLRDVGVLVRPHPQNAEQWEQDDLADLGDLRIWPRAGAVPVDVQSRADYFDSIYHSAAVVGVNTTAEIESAIVGRPVYTLLDPEFRETQDGTLHFQHLRHVNGGLLHIASTFEEHVAQLAEAVSNPSAADEQCRRFVAAFVRPYGVAEPATPRLVAAIEALGAMPAPGAVTMTPVARVARLLLRPVAARRKQEAATEAKNKMDKAELKAKKREDRARHEEARGAAAAAELEKGDARRDQEADSDMKPAKPAGKVNPPLNKLSRVAQVSQAFQALPEAARHRFLEDNVLHLPAKLLLDAASVQRLDYPHAEIFLRLTSRTERKRLRACAKEPFTVDWIEQTVRAGEVFYDIGANVGAYSLIAAKKPSGAARVVAFEPGFANINALAHNIVLNQLGDNITPLAIALSNHNGLAHFNLRELQPGSAKHMLEAESADGPTIYAQPVITYRLDDLVTLLNLPLPNHIKLDVDGSEMAVLEGATRTMESPSLRSMLLEVSTELSETVTKFVEARGLELVSRINVRSKSGEYRVWYGLFGRDKAGISALAVGPERPLAADK